jgi:hypothetical protein
VATPGQVNSVTVEDVDQSLLRIAAFDPRSSPAVQSLASTWKDPDGIESLVNLYQRLKGREAKWLTRLILKTYAPIKFPENLEPGPQHSFLPTCVQLKIKFPSSAAPPVRRDGTRIIAGVGTKNPAILTPNPRRIAHQSSSPPQASIATRPLGTPATSLPKPNSSPLVPSVSLPRKVASTPNSSLPVLTVPSSVGKGSVFTPQPILSTPASSMPALSPHNQHTSPPRSICAPYFSGPTVKPSAKSQPSPSRTTLGPLSQNIQSLSPPKSPWRAIRAPKPLIVTGGIGICQYTSHACPLVGCIFVFGPSIPKSSYIHDELLSWHGSRYTTSIQALDHPTFQRRCSRTGKRFKRIALIESRDEEATVKFLKQIRNWTSTNDGKKERVEVYDWRLLEYATKIDQGKTFDYDPWARCWICNI